MKKLLLAGAILASASFGAVASEQVVIKCGSDYSVEASVDGGKYKADIYHGKVLIGRGVSFAQSGVYNNSLFLTIAPLENAESGRDYSLFTLTIPSAGNNQFPVLGVSYSEKLQQHSPDVSGCKIQ